MRPARLPIIPSAKISKSSFLAWRRTPTSTCSRSRFQNPKFGLAWYIGDIVTDGTGTGVGNFVGRFNIETFVVSLAALPAPQVFTNPPFPDAKVGVVVNPVQLYHLGLWFNSPDDAKKAGCPTNVTPFNGEHNAGIQVLNTAGFPNDKGPLINLK
jgi:hypothetical protein